MPLDILFLTQQTCLIPFNLDGDAHKDVVGEGVHNVQVFARDYRVVISTL